MTTGRGGELLPDPYDRVTLIGPYMCPTCRQAYWHEKAQCTGCTMNSHKAVAVVRTAVEDMFENDFRMRSLYPRRRRRR